jgi:hypothetical protein
MFRPRRRLFIALGLLACVLLTGVAWLLWPRGSGITRANAARIAKGMTLDEVEALLGGPARDESTGPLNPDHKLGFGPGGVVREWRSDEVIIHVTMDRNGHVSTNMVIPVHRVPDPIQRFGRQSPLARLQRWLGL